MNRRLSTGRWAASLVGISCIVAACGSSGSSSSGGGGGGSATGQKATGQPILIGFINQENTSAGSFPEIRVADQAAVSYINNELNGVNGQPLQLVTCTTDGQATTSQQCAQKMVDQKVTLVTMGIDFGTSSSVPVLQAAKIPLVGGVPLLPPEFTSPDVFMFIGGSAAAFPDQDLYIAKIANLKKVRIIYTDNDAGKAAADGFGKQILAAFGVTDVKLIPEKADAADFTPSLSAAMADSPDAVMVLFAAPGCIGVMQAKQSLGVSSSTKFFYPGSCLDDSVIKAGGAGAEGAYFNNELLLYNDTNDPEVQTYRTKLQQYAQGTVKFSGFSQSGFSAIMNIQEMLKSIGTGSISSASIVNFLKNAKNQHNFMTHPYTCDGTATGAAKLTSVCNVFDRIVQLQNGQPVDVYGKWLSGFAPGQQ